jgi:dihydrofolate reductase
MQLISVAAVAENGVIGRNDELPWPSIPADKHQYRNRIADWPVILGRRTFESMREDLPGTAQVVLSRSKSAYDAKSVYHAPGVNSAVKLIETLGSTRAYVIGGAEIYDLFLPLVDKMLLSRVPGEYDGDAYFPKCNTDEWTIKNRTVYDAFTLEEWVREQNKRV